MTLVDEKDYYPGLDALRGIAILLVVVYHYFSFFEIGWIGVDLFFVLSGFLITTILLKARNKDGFFRNFYIRRAFRILPLYYLTIILFYLVAPVVFSDKSISSTYTYYDQNKLWFLAFAQNWLIIIKGPPPEPYLKHFWTLAIEEQFYLVWPFLIYYIKSYRLLKVVLLFLFFTAILFRFFHWYSNNPNHPYYYSLFARMDGLVAGAFLSLNWYNKRVFSRKFSLLACIMFLLLIVFSKLIFDNVDPDNLFFATIGYSLIALFFISTCNFVLQQPTWITENKILQRLGRISYGIYVYHLPVYLALHAIAQKITNNIIVNDVLFFYSVSFLCILTTFMLSIISYKTVELPLLKLRNKFRN